MSQAPQIKSIPKGVIVAIAGDIDYSVSSQLRTVIRNELDKKPQLMIIDLSGVPYMDSSGVAVLVEALQAQTKGKRTLAVCCLQEKVRGIFEIARLDMVFKIYSSVDEAQEA
jgi:anti-sigma B factor antagonist